MKQAQLWVELIRFTPQPQELAAMAARLCYSPLPVDRLKSSAGTESFIEKLVDMGHLSPIEHMSFTFGVGGVSRALLAQLTRHRIASFSVQSQRYVDSGQGFDYILPPSIAALGPEAVLEYQEQMASMHAFYCRWLKDIPAEDARFVLPNACATQLILTMNARELLHFFGLRCCNRAQWEIRALAWTMLGLARQAAPALFSSAGPGCLGGGCREGRMSCGDAAGIRKLSEELNDGPDDLHAWIRARFMTERK